MQVFFKLALCLLTPMGQSKSHGQPRIKGKENRFHHLMRGSAASHVYGMHARKASSFGHFYTLLQLSVNFFVSSKEKPNTIKERNSQFINIYNVIGTLLDTKLHIFI